LRYDERVSPADQHDEKNPLIEALVRDVDLTLVRRNLALTPQKRIDQLVEMQRFAAELAEANRKARSAR
jgi:hypothetical protein